MLEAHSNDSKAAGGTGPGGAPLLTADSSFTVSASPTAAGATRTAASGS